MESPDLTPDGDQKIIEQTVAKSRRLPDKLLSGQKNFWEALCFHIVSASHFTIPVEALHFDDSSGDDSLPEVCALIFTSPASGRSKVNSTVPKTLAASGAWPVSARCTHNNQRRAYVLGRSSATTDGRTDRQTHAVETRARHQPGSIYSQTDRQMDSLGSPGELFLWEAERQAHMRRW